MLLKLNQAPTTPAYWILLFLGFKVFISAEAGMTSTICLIVFTVCASSWFIHLQWQLAFANREAACLTCNGIKARGFGFIRPASVLKLLCPLILHLCVGVTYNFKEKHREAEIQKKKQINNKWNIEAFPGFTSVHKIYQPQSLISSLFPAGSKTTKQEQIN